MSLLSSSSACCLVFGFFFRNLHSFKYLAENCPTDCSQTVTGECVVTYHTGGFDDECPYFDEQDDGAFAADNFTSSIQHVYDEKLSLCVPQNITLNWTVEPSASTVLQGFCLTIRDIDDSTSEYVFFSISSFNSSLTQEWTFDCLQESLRKNFLMKLSSVPPRDDGRHAVQITVDTRDDFFPGDKDTKECVPTTTSAVTTTTTTTTTPAVTTASGITSPPTATTTTAETTAPNTSTEPPETTEGSSETAQPVSADGITDGEIAGIVVGVVAAIVLIIMLIVLLRRGVYKNQPKTQGKETIERVDLQTVSDGKEYPPSLGPGTRTSDTATCYSNDGFDDISGNFKHPPSMGLSDMDSCKLEEINVKHASSDSGIHETLYSLPETIHMV